MLLLYCLFSSCRFINLLTAVFKNADLDQLARLEGVGKLGAKLLADTALSDLKDRVHILRKRAQIGSLFTV